MTPNFCPRCSHPWNDKPVPLSTCMNGRIKYCAGPDGDGGCGFQYDLKTNERYRMVCRHNLMLWIFVPLALITFFKVNLTHYREPY